MPLRFLLSFCGKPLNIEVRINTPWLVSSLVYGTESVCFSQWSFWRDQPVGKDQECLQASWPAVIPLIFHYAHFGRFCFYAKSPQHLHNCTCHETAQRAEKRGQSVLPSFRDEMVSLCSGSI